MTGFVETETQKHMLLWLALTIIAWFITAYFISRRTFIANWRSRGITLMNITLNRRIEVAKLVDLVAEKEKTSEECLFEKNKQLVKVTYKDPTPSEWGGAAPFVTLEYDEKNKILQSVIVQYNRREARKDSVLSAHELKQKLMHELGSKNIFVEEDEAIIPPTAMEKRKSMLWSKAD
jgi:hypothetical protein